MVEVTSRLIPNTFLYPFNVPFKVVTHNRMSLVYYIIIFLNLKSTEFVKNILCNDVRE